MYSLKYCISFRVNATKGQEESPIMFYIHSVTWIYLFNSFHNRFRNRPRVANASHTAITYNIKAKFGEKWCDS